MINPADIRKLSEENWQIALEYLNNILAELFSAINNKMPYNEELLQYILDLIYKCLEKIYSNTASKLDILYKDLKPFKVTNLFDLTYQKDGKTIEERVEEYLQEVFQIKNPIAAKQLISFKLYRLMRTEVSHLETMIKKNKISISANVIVIEGSCNCNGICDQYIGVYAIDENIEYPPYHPNCTCINYYDQTDNIDDIEDNNIEQEDWDIDI